MSPSLCSASSNAVILVFRRSLTERDPLFTPLFSLREETAAQDRLNNFLCALFADACV